MMSPGHARGEACATQSSSMSSSISSTITSPRVTVSGLYAMSDHGGAHRDGYSDDKCRDVLVRFCSGISRNYKYADGLQLVYEKLREYLGDENLDLSSGVLYELIEVPSQFTSDEGAPFRRWKHDHCHRNGDLLNGHVPRLGNVVISQVVPTERLRHWREGHTVLNPSGSSAISDGDATKGDPMKRYGIKGRSEWQINHTLYMSSRHEGTRVIYCPNPKEFHELSWNYGHGSGGTLLGKKTILEDDKSPPKVSMERALGFAIVQPLPCTSRAMIARAVKKINMNFRYPMSCLALFMIRKQKEIDIRYDHMSWSVLEYESQDEYRNLPDVDSVQGRIYYGHIPDHPVPEGVMVSGQFARKFGLITPGENLADLKIVKSMPTAEDLAITRGLEAYKNAGVCREDSRWHSPGPETAQLFKDDGSMAYKWLRPETDLLLFGNFNRPRLWNTQPPGGLDGADDGEKAPRSRIFRCGPDGKESATCVAEDEIEEKGRQYGEVASETYSHRRMMPQENMRMWPSKIDTFSIQQTVSRSDHLGDEAKLEHSKARKGPPPFLKLVQELKEANASGLGTGRSTLNVSDDALTLCNSPAWAVPEHTLLSPADIHEVSNSDETLLATESILPILVPSSEAKCALEPATQLENIKYNPSVKACPPELPSVDDEEAEVRESNLFQKILKRVRRLKQSHHLKKIRRLKENRKKNRTEQPKYVHQETLDILEGRAGPIVVDISPTDPILFCARAILGMRSEGHLEDKESLDCVVRSTPVSSASSIPLVERLGSYGLSRDVPHDESTNASSQTKAAVESDRKKRIDSSLKNKRKSLWRSPVNDFEDLEVIPEDDCVDRLDDPFIDSKSTIKADHQRYKLDTPKNLPKFLSNIQTNQNLSTRSSLSIAELRYKQSTHQFARTLQQKAAGLEIQKAEANILLRKSEENFALNTISDSETLPSNGYSCEHFVPTTTLRYPLDYSQKITPIQHSQQTFIQSRNLQLVRHQKYIAAMSSPRKTNFSSSIMGNFVQLEPPDNSTPSSFSAREIKNAENAKFYDQIARSNPYKPEPTSGLTASQLAVSRDTEFGDFMQPANLQGSNSVTPAELYKTMSEMQSAQKPVLDDTLLPRGSSSTDIIDLQRACYDKNPELYYAPGPLKLPPFEQIPHLATPSQPLSQSIKKQLPDVPEVDETSVQSTPAAKIMRSPSPGKKLFGEGGWLGTSMDPNEVPAKQYTKVKSDRPGMMAQMKTAMQEIGRKADFSPVKMLHNALRKDKKEIPTVRTPISLTPAQQAQVYVDLELLICAVANRFLVHESKSGRLTADSARKISEYWRKKGRDQVIEFQYDQSTQRNLISLNLQVLRFYGVAACNPVQISALLHSWSAAAREMAVRTFCSPDTVIDKHLSFAYKLLDLLGAEVVFFMALQEIRGTFNNIVKNVREGQQLKGAQHDAQMPSQSSVPFAPGKAAFGTSKPLQRSQSFRQSFMSSFSRRTGGSSSTKQNV